MTPEQILKGKKILDEIEVAKTQKDIWEKATGLKEQIIFTTDSFSSDCTDVKFIDFDYLRHSTLVRIEIAIKKMEEDLAAL